MIYNKTTKLCECPADKPRLENKQCYAWLKNNEFSLIKYKIKLLKIIKLINTNH